MSDLNFQDISSVQSALGPKAVSTVGAVTQAISTFMTIITGTGTAIATITPPVSGDHMLVAIFTNATPNTLTTGGNIQRAVTPLQNIPVLLFYNSKAAQYYVLAYAS